MSAISSNLPRSTTPIILGDQVPAANTALAQDSAESNTFSLLLEKLGDSVNEIPFIKKLPIELASLIFTEIFSSFPLYKVAEIAKIGEEKKWELWEYAWLYIRKELHCLFPKWLSADKELEAFIRDAREYGGKTYEQIFEGFALFKNLSASLENKLGNYQNAGIINAAPELDIHNCELILRNQLLKSLQENPRKILTILRWFPAQNSTVDLLTEASKYIDFTSLKENPQRTFDCLHLFSESFSQNRISILLIEAVESRNLNLFKGIFEFSLSRAMTQEINQEPPFYKEALKIAAVYEDVDAIRYIVNRLGNNIRLELCEDSLHKIAKNGWLDMVQLFIQKKVKLDALNEHGQTAAEAAVYAISKFYLQSSMRKSNEDHYKKQINLLKIVCCLIQEGKKGEVDFYINWKLKDTNTTLLHALCYAQSLDGLEQLAALLVTQNVNLLHAQDDDGNTPLHVAVEAKNHEMMRFLLNQNAKIDVKNNSHLTVIELANKVGDLQTLEILLQGQPSLLRKTLEQAVKNADLDKVRWLVKIGASLDRSKIEGRTAAEIAVSAISGRWFSSLRRLDRNEEYQRDINLLKIACYLIQQEHEREVHFDISCAPEDTTLLHAACYAQPPDGMLLAAFLVKQNPDLVHSQDMDGNTPLHVAVEAKNHEMMRFLLNQNAKIDVKNNSHLTVIELANKVGDLQTLEILLQGQPSLLRKTLEQAVKNADLDKVRWLVKIGASLDRSKIEGRTAAEIAVSAISGRWFSSLRRLDRNEEYQRDINLLKIACYLIQQEHEREVHFDISCAPEDTTLLHAACYAQPPDGMLLAAFLVKQNPDLVHSQDMDGNTPLYVAVEEKNHKMIKFLLGKGAKADAENGFNSKTAIQLAHDIGDAEALEILEEKLRENFVSVAAYITQKEALKQAIQNRDIAEVKDIFDQIEANACINLCNETFHQVAETGSLEMTKLWVQKGAKLYIKAQGKTAAEAAVCAISGLWFLPSIGARSERKEKNYQKGISLLKVAYYLIQQGWGKGVDFDIGWMPKKTTLLHIACYMQPFDESVLLAAFLVEKNANLVLSEDFRKKIPLDIAREVKNQEMINFLLGHRTKLNKWNRFYAATFKKWTSGVGFFKTQKILNENPLERRAPVASSIIDTPILTGDYSTHNLIENTATQKKMDKLVLLKQAFHYLYTCLFSILTFIPLSLYWIFYNWIPSIAASFKGDAMSYNRHGP